jgi:hypothetical protein
MAKNLPIIKYTEDKLFEIMNSLSEVKKQEEVNKTFESLETKILLLCYMGFYVEYNLNDFDSTVAFNDYCKFCDYLINSLGPTINCEGGIIAMLKILINFLHNREFDGKNYFLKNSSKIAESIFKAAIPFYKFENITFDFSFLSHLAKLFDLLGTQNKDNTISDNYLNYIENVTLRSLEFMDNYINSLKLKQPIHSELESTISIIKDVTMNYIKQDCNQEILKNIMKKLSTQCLDLIPLIDGENKKSAALPFWEMIHILLIKDSSDKIVKE